MPGSMETGTKARSKSYSEQFKRQTLKRAQGYKSIRAAALSLGVPVRTLFDWSRRASRRTPVAVKAHALALGDTGLSSEEVAANCNVAPSTVRAWRNGKGLGSADGDEIAENRAEWRQRFVEEAEDLIGRCFERAGVELDNASFKELVTAIAQLTDKRQLLAGEPTSITAAVVYDQATVRDIIAHEAELHGLSFEDGVQGAIEIAEEQG